MTETGATEVDQEKTELRLTIESQSNEIKKYQQQVLQLGEKLVKESHKDRKELNEADSTFIPYIMEQFDAMMQENEELRTQYIKIKAREAKNKAMIKTLQYKLEDKPSQSSSEKDQKIDLMTAQINELQAKLKCANDEITELLQINDKMKRKQNQTFEKLKNYEGKLQVEFDILKQKLDEARQANPVIASEEIQISSLKSQLEKLSQELENERSKCSKEVSQLTTRNEDLVNENQRLNKAFEDVERASKQITNAQISFINEISQTLGVTSTDEIKEELNKLISLKTDRMQILNAPVHDSNGNVQSFQEIRDALQQIMENLSPNELKLPQDSELRQLFAALYNMINQSLNPNANKSLLQPHIRAVVFQARAFKPQEVVASPSRINSSSSPHKIDEPPLKRFE